MKNTVLWGYAAALGLTAGVVPGMVLANPPAAQAQSRAAVESVLRDGFRTRDLGTGAGAKMVGCKAMGRLVRERIESLDGEN